MTISRQLEEKDFPHYLLIVQEATTLNNIFVKVEKLEEFFYTLISSDEYFAEVCVTDKDEPFALFVGLIGDNFFNDGKFGIDLFWYSLKNYNKSTLCLLKNFEKWCKDNNCTEVLLDIVPESGFNKIFKKLNYKLEKIGYRRKI